MYIWILISWLLSPDPSLSAFGEIHVIPLSMRYDVDLYACIFFIVIYIFLARTPELSVSARNLSSKERWI